jgi:hypothetical protein
MSKPTSRKTVKKKNPAAVALGRLGGLKGGPARMAKLSAKERSELGRKAISARWNKNKKSTRTL